MVVNGTAFGKRKQCSGVALVVNGGILSVVVRMTESTENRLDLDVDNDGNQMIQFYCAK